MNIFNDDDDTHVLEDYNDIDLQKWLVSNYFLCDIPFDLLIEKLTDQCSNYIGTEDDENYFTMFFNSLFVSYANLDDDMEENPDEAKEALQNLEYQFIDNVVELLDTHVGVFLPMIETTLSSDKMVILQSLYEYFILGAKDNFKNVLAVYLNKIIGGI